MNRAPISALEACQQGVEWSEIQVSGGQVYWLQFDPNGAITSVVTPRGERLPKSMTDDDLCVRSRVHEYGGGAFCVAGDALLLVREQDQALCRLPVSKDGLGELQVLLHQSGYRYGDLVYDHCHHRLLAVEEYHPEGDLPAQVINRLVAIDPDNGQRSVLVEGADFYASPRVSSDGRKLAWLSWNHPDQPWLSTCLMEAQLDSSGNIQLIQQLADGWFGGKSESIYQPEYAEDGCLYFTSDRSGWWNLYCSTDGNLKAVTEPLALELGAAQWQLGLSRYTLIGDHLAVCSFVEEGRFGLMVIDLRNGRLRRLPQRWSALQSVVSDQEEVYAIAQYPHKGAELLKISGDLLEAPQIDVLADLNGDQLSSAAFSLPNHIQFETAGESSAYGFYYPAQNLQQGKLPALII
ncbi:MAG: hypothetical protein OQK12_00085, partial [Motiliproteus sp.]|nr:hypothetical protein [Motiliproteus sp.]